MPLGGRGISSPAEIQRLLVDLVDSNGKKPDSKQNWGPACLSCACIHLIQNADMWPPTLLYCTVCLFEFLNGISFVIVGYSTSTLNSLSKRAHTHAEFNCPPFKKGCSSTLLLVHRPNSFLFLLFFSSLHFSCVAVFPWQQCSASLRPGMYTALIFVVSPLFKMIHLYRCTFFSFLKQKFILRPCGQVGNI